MLTHAQRVLPPACAHPRSDTPTLHTRTHTQAYESMPIEEFGRAMLLGMGWKEGQGVGRNRKVQGATHTRSHATTAQQQQPHRPRRRHGGSAAAAACLSQVTRRCG